MIHRTDFTQEAINRIEWWIDLVRELPAEWREEMVVGVYYACRQEILEARAKIRTNTFIQEQAESARRTIR